MPRLCVFPSTRAVDPVAVLQRLQQYKVKDEEETLYLSIMFAGSVKGHTDRAGLALQALGSLSLEPLQTTLEWLVSALERDKAQELMRAFEAWRTAAGDSSDASTEFLSTRVPA